jgi:hypothetical protein
MRDRRRRAFGFLGGENGSGEEKQGSCDQDYEPRYLERVPKRPDSLR